MRYYKISEERSRQIIEDAMNAGWLLWISTSAWGNRKQLAEEILEEKFKEDADAISAVVRLIDSEYVRAVTKPMSQAQTMARRESLTWFHKAVYFVVEGRRIKLDDFIKECYDTMIKNRIILVSKYPELREKALNEHPNIIQEEFFPSPARLEDAFNLVWGWQKIQLPMGDGKIKVVSPEFAERENKKFVELMKKNAEESVAMLRLSFLQIASKLRDVLVDPNAKFKSSTVEKPKLFLQQFKDINIFGDKPFENLVGDLQDILDGVFAEDLKDDEEYRKEMGEIMTEVVEEFENLPVVKYKRDIQF